MWIRTAAKFYEDEESEEAISSHYVFNMADVKTYNRTADKYTTLCLNDNDRMTVAIKFETFHNRFKKFKSAGYFKRLSRLMGGDNFERIIE